MKNCDGGYEEAQLFAGLKIKTVNPFYVTWTGAEMILQKNNVRDRRTLINKWWDIHLMEYYIAIKNKYTED